MQLSNKLAQYQALRDELAVTIARGMKKHKVTGMSIALQDGEDIVWAHGFGYADKLQKRKASADTIYKAGSISKVFTATAVMQLVEQGMVDIDAPIQTYIPELKPIYHMPVNTPVTLRLIMAHRSGLSGDKIAGMFSLHPQRFDTVIEYINSVHSPYAPDTIAAYSNIAIDLLGVVIERVSGERFEDYLRNHILQPLEMYESDFEDVRINQAMLSKGYSRNKARAEYPIRNRPAGNLFTSVLELSKFAAMVIRNGHPILQPQTLQSMLSEQTHSDSLLDMGMRFAMNWVIGRPKLNHLGKVVWHDGGTINFMSTMIVVPDHQLSAVVLSNSSLSLPFVEEIADSLLIKAAQVKSGIQPPPTAQLPEQITCPDEILKSMPGTYATMVGPIKCYAARGKLKARVAFFTALLRYHADGWLTPYLRIFGIIPLSIKAVQGLRVKLHMHDNDTYKELLLAEYQGTRLLAGIKIQPVQIPTAWKECVGIFKAELQPDEYVWFKEVKLNIKDGFLMAFMKVEGQGGGAVILKPISDDMAVLEGIGRGMQETVYLSHDNGNPVLRYGGYRFAKVK